MNTLGARTFSFDGANRLAGLVLSGGANYSYTYNGEGERVSQAANGATISYTLDLNSDLPQVLSDGTNLYFPGIGQANIDGSAPEFYISDANGSTRLMTDAGGAVAGDPQDYDPFGNTGDTPGSPIGYSGEWKDASGLIFLRARYYDPSTGTFISKDPLRGSINAPASMNGYNYADDDPIDGSDPSGRCDWFRSFTDSNYSFSEARADCARDEYLANFAQQNGYSLGISTLIRLGNIAALNDELSAINSGKEFIADLFSNCSEVSGPAWGQLVRNVFVNFPLIAWIGEGGAPTEPDFEDIPAEGEPFNQFATFTPEEWSEFLAQDGTEDWLQYVPDAYKRDVARSFTGTTFATTLNHDITVYRYWGGTSAETGSPYFSFDPNLSSDEARSSLALPNGNLATNVSEFVIPKSTTIIIGVANSQVDSPTGLFGSYATGGSMQIYLPNPNSAILIK